MFISLFCNKINNSSVLQTQFIGIFPTEKEAVYSTIQYLFDHNCFWSNCKDYIYEFLDAIQYNKDESFKDESTKVTFDGFELQLLDWCNNYIDQLNVMIESEVKQLCIQLLQHSFHTAKELYTFCEDHFLGQYAYKWNILIEQNGEMIKKINT